MTAPAEQQPLSWQHNAEIAVPSPKLERRLAIREVDWARLKRGITQIQRPLPTLSFVSSALVGVAVSAGLTIIPLFYSQGLPAWVVPLYCWLTFFSALMAAALFYIERAFLKRHQDDSTSIMTDMSDIERLFPKDDREQTPDEPSA